MRRILHLRLNGGGKRKWCEEEDFGWEFKSRCGAYTIENKKTKINICLIDSKYQEKSEINEYIICETQCGFIKFNYNTLRKSQNGILYINEDSLFCIKTVNKKIWDNVINFFKDIDETIRKSTSFIATTYPSISIQRHPLEKKYGYMMNYYEYTLDTVQDIDIKCIMQTKTHIMALLEKNYIHGDIKFSNVLLNKNDVFLTDFDGVYKYKDDQINDILFITPLYVNYAYLNHRFHEIYKNKSEDIDIDIDKLMTFIFSPYNDNASDLYKTFIKQTIMSIIGLDTVDAMNTYFNQNKKHLIKYADLYSLGICCITNKNKDVKELGYDYLKEALIPPDVLLPPKGGGDLPEIPSDILNFIDNYKDQKFLIHCQQ